MSQIIGKNMEYEMETIARLMALGRGFIWAFIVVSQNRGTPMQIPVYYNTYYGDPQNGTSNLGKHTCRTIYIIPQ